MVFNQTDFDLSFCRYEVSGKRICPLTIICWIRALLKGWRRSSLCDVCYLWLVKCTLPTGWGDFFVPITALKNWMSDRHGFLRGGVVSTLCRLSSFKPFFLSGDFRILLFNHFGKLFFAFLSCVGVDIELFAFAVWQFRRIAAFPFLFADPKYAPRSGAAYLRLFRLEFRSYGRFRCSVGCLSVPAQSAFISAEPPFDFVGGGALHIVSDMGVYVQRVLNLLLVLFSIF